MPPQARLGLGGSVSPTPLSSSFSFAMRRARPDAERLGNLQNTHALRKLLSNLPFRRTVYLRPAKLHALCDGALEACFDALANHRPLRQRRLNDIRPRVLRSAKD
jgi:hypothetical protein